MMINSKVGKETGRTNFFHWQIMSRLLAAFALAAAGAFAAYLYGRCTLPPPDDDDDDDDELYWRPNTRKRVQTNEQGDIHTARAMTNGRDLAGAEHLCR
jgi:hypothetical protein